MARLLLYTLQVYILIQTTSAQNDTPLNTTRETVGWVHGPNYRSTSDIVFSCVLTMTLCVWSALHLNIPAAKQSSAREWIRNTGWVCLGIFGPELVMFTAWKQWASARALQNMMQNKIQCSRCPDDKLKNTISVDDCPCGRRKGSITANVQPPDWTVVQGFYATMGGFVFELDSQSASTILNTPTEDIRFTITPQGLQLLAECGLDLAIETREILDKNKSDGLTKAIVILQAGWMVVQSISRLGYRLPVTLLEVNTIGHVICALFIYVLWWRKPRGVTEATVLKAPWVPAMAAYMMMSSDLDSTDGWRQWATLKPPLLPELCNLTFMRERSDSNSLDDTNPETVTTFLSAIEEDCDIISNRAHKAGFASLGLATQIDLNSVSVKGQKSFQHYSDQARIENLTQSARWKLALEAMDMLPHLCCRLEDLQKSINSEVQTYQPQVMLRERASNWPTKGSIPPYRGMLMGMALWFASIAFGAVHVAAWNDNFPTTTEKWLWRISSLYLAWAGLLWLSVCFFGAVSHRFVVIWDRCITGHASKPVYMFLIPLCSICGTIYAFARVFLVIESVISLRKLPPRMYLTPDWSEMIPHL